MNGAPLPSMIGTSRLSISNDRVVDAHAVQHAQQVLGGGDQHALAHQAGRVTHTGDVFPAGGNAEILEIGALENNAGRRRGGQNPHIDTGTPLCRPTPLTADRALSVVSNRNGKLVIV